MPTLLSEVWCESTLLAARTAFMFLVCLAANCKRLDLFGLPVGGWCSPTGQVSDTPNT